MMTHTPTDQLTYNQLWLLSTGERNSDKHIGGMTLPGRSTGRGIAAIVHSLDKRGLLIASRGKFRLTRKGEATRDQWRRECETARTTPRAIAALYAGQKN